MKSFPKELQESFPIKEMSCFLPWGQITLGARALLEEGGTGWGFIFSQKSNVKRICEHCIICYVLQRGGFLFRAHQSCSALSPMIPIQGLQRNGSSKSERKGNFSLKIRYRLSLQNAGGNSTSDGVWISSAMDTQPFIKTHSSRAQL